MIKLDGMFFSRSTEDGLYAGQVIGEPTPGHYLVKVDSDSTSGVPVSPMELICAHDMGDDLGGDGLPSWKFFATRTDLNAWLAWIATPDPKEPAKPKIVKFKKDLQ